MSSMVSTRPRRGEFVVLAVLAVAGFVFTLLETRELWFYADFWGLIDDDPGALPHLLEPHAGHFAVLHTAGALALAAVSDLGSVWPWSTALRAMGWFPLVGVMWWVVRRRGADPRIALAMAAVLCFYGGSAWLTGWYLGGPVAMAIVVYVAQRVTEVEQPTARDVAATSVLLLLAASSSSTGLIGIVSVGLVVVATRRSVRWWPAFGVAGVAYLAWRSVAATRGASPDLSREVLLELPGQALQIVQIGFARLLTLPPPAWVWAWVVVAALAVMLVVQALQRRMDAFDVVLLLWGAMYLGAAITIRVAAGQANLTAVRYGYVIVLLSLLLAVPRLRLPSGYAAAVALVLATGWLVVGNADTLAAGFQFWEDRSSASREVVESAAAMLANGEPFMVATAVDPPRAGMLTTDQLAELVAAGWRPPMRGAEAELMARGGLRVRLGPTPSSLEVSCAAVPTGTEVDLADGGWIRVGEGAVSILTRDEFGEGRKQISGAPGRLARVDVTPETRTTLVSDDPTIEFCRDG